MSLPEPKFIPESDVPKNKQSGFILKMLQKIPLGKSAVLEFPDKAEAIRRQSNIISIISQQKRREKLKNYHVCRVGAVVYVTNSEE
jgi:hypothetical protein